MQYLLLSPSYINVLNVYAFCNTNDISWGTKGPDVPPPIEDGSVKTIDGVLDISVPKDDQDLDEQFKAERKALEEEAVIVEEKPSETQVQKDGFAGIRSYVVLAWVFSNCALAATILNSAGLDRASSDDKESKQRRSQIYLAVVLWSVVGLSAFRFGGATWFLVRRFVSLNPYPYFSGKSYLLVLFNLD